MIFNDKYNKILNFMLDFRKDVKDEFNKMHKTLSQDILDSCKKCKDFEIKVFGRSGLEHPEMSPDESKWLGDYSMWIDLDGELVFHADTKTGCWGLDVWPIDPEECDELEVRTLENAGDQCVPFGSVIFEAEKGVDQEYEFGLYKAKDGYRVFMNKINVYDQSVIEGPFEKKVDLKELVSQAEMGEE